MIDDDHIYPEVILGRVFQVVSAISGLYVFIVVFGILKLRQDTVSKMAFMIILAETLYAFPFALLIKGQAYCTSRNFAEVYGAISINLWTVCLSRYLKLTVHSQHISSKTFMIYTLICQGIPLCFALPGFWIKYTVWEEESKTCWRDRDSGTFDYELFFQRLFPVIVCVTLSFIYCGLSFRRMQEIKERLELSKADTFGFLLFKPIITSLIWAPILVMEIFRICGMKIYVYTWAFDVTYLQAFLSAVGFTFLSTFREGIKSFCCKGKESANLEESELGVQSSQNQYSKLDEIIITRATIPVKEKN